MVQGKHGNNTLGLGAGPAVGPQSFFESRGYPPVRSRLVSRPAAAGAYEMKARARPNENAAIGPVTSAVAKAPVRLGSGPAPSRSSSTLKQRLPELSSSLPAKKVATGLGGGSAAPAAALAVPSSSAAVAPVALPVPAVAASGLGASTASKVAAPAGFRDELSRVFCADISDAFGAEYSKVLTKKLPKKAADVSFKVRPARVAPARC